MAVVATPLKHCKAVPAGPLAGKVVIDACNDCPGRDGRIPGLDNKQATSSRLVAAHLPQSKAVKTFNAIMMPHFDRNGQPPGSPGRRALPLAADNEGAKETVAGLYGQFGFGPADVGPLSESWRFETNAPVCCGRSDRR